MHVYHVAVTLTFRLALAVGMAVYCTAEESPEIRWRGVDRERTGTEGVTFEITVPVGDGREPRVLHLRNRTTDIRDVGAYRRYLTVLGSMGSTAEIVTVMDIITGEQKLVFLCWNPTVSPTGRFIVFKRFYPRFTDPDLISDVIGVVDLESPLEQEQAVTATASASGPRLWAGFPVYPEYNLRTARAQPHIGRMRHMVDTPLLWRDDKTFVLLDIVTYRDTGSRGVLVREVRLGGPTRARLHEVPLTEHTVAVLGQFDLKGSRLDKERKKLIIELFRYGTLEIELP